MKKYFLILFTLITAFFASIGEAVSEPKNFFQQQSFDALSDDFVGVIRQVEALDKAPVERFSFTITNTTGSDLRIALFTGFIPTARQITGGGVTVPMIGTGTPAYVPTTPLLLYDDPQHFSTLKSVDAVLGDGLTITNGRKVIYAAAVAPDTANIHVAYDGAPISYFQNFVHEVDCLIDTIDITVNDQECYNKASMIIKTINPFDDDRQHTIYFKDFFDNDVQQDKKIVVNIFEKYKKIVQLDKHTVVMLNIPGTVNAASLAVMTMQFNVKPLQNTSKFNINEAIKMYKSAEKNGTLDMYKRAAEEKIAEKLGFSTKK